MLIKGIIKCFYGRNIVEISLIKLFIADTFFFFLAAGCVVTFYIDLLPL